MEGEGSDVAISLTSSHPSAKRGGSVGRPAGELVPRASASQARGRTREDGLWAPPIPPATPPASNGRSTPRAAGTRTCEPRGSRPPHQLRLRAFRDPLSRLDQPLASHVGQ